MNTGRTVFSQVIELLPHQEFQKCVARYGGDRYLKNFSCWDQYLAMAFAQLTYRESLRDIEACLRSLQRQAVSPGIPWQGGALDAGGCERIAGLAHLRRLAQRAWLPSHAGCMSNEPLGVDLEQSLYAMDSTTIDLCLALFPWARFRRRRKAAVKLHTLLDLRGNIPTFIRVTDGKVHDVHTLDEIMPEAGAFYVMDRGYVDFQRLSSSLRLVRPLLCHPGTKSNLMVQRRYSHPVDRERG